MKVRYQPTTKEKLGYALIFTPIVVSIALGAIFLGLAFLQGIGIGCAIIIPMLIGFQLLK